MSSYAWTVFLGFRTAGSATIELRGFDVVFAFFGADFFVTFGGMDLFVTLSFEAGRIIVLPTLVFLALTLFTDFFTGTRGSCVGEREEKCAAIGRMCVATDELRPTLAWGVACVLLEKETFVGWRF